MRSLRGQFNQREAIFLAFLVVRTVLEFATIFLYTSIGRRGAAEARGARHASILRRRVDPSSFHKRRASAEVQLKRALRSEIYQAETRGDALLRPQRAAAESGGQRAA